jgi:hypothetical protein
MGIKDWFSQRGLQITALPINRVSVEPVDLLQTMKNLSARWKGIDPRFPREWLRVIEKSVMLNQDLSQAHELMIDLGNTGHTVAVTGSRSEEATQELQDLASILDTDALVNSLLSQIALYGCISAEIVINPDMSGIKKVVRVPPPSVFFTYDPEKDIYLPWQLDVMGQEIQLNTDTYIYSPLLTIDGSPYAIPPFLAALSAVEVQEEFKSELKGAARKLGLLGLMDIEADPPPKAPAETEKEYLKRILDYLQSFVDSISENIKKGIVAHFKNMKATHYSVSADAAGVKDIIELNNQWVLSGAKVQPSLLGRTTGSTETWATVSFAQFTSQLDNYRRLIKRTIERVYKTHLVLKGIDVDDVTVTFNPAPSINPDKEASVKKSDTETICQQYAAGIITLEEARIKLGYEPQKKE